MSGGNIGTNAVFCCIHNAGLKGRVHLSVGSGGRISPQSVDHSHHNLGFLDADIHTGQICQAGNGLRGIEAAGTAGVIGQTDKTLRIFHFQNILGQFAVQALIVVLGAGEQEGQREHIQSGAELSQGSRTAPEQINGTVLKLFCNSSGSAQGAGIIHFDFNPAVGALINQVCKFLAALSGREIRGLVFAEPKNHIRGFLHSLCSRDCSIPAHSCCSIIRRGRVSTGNSAQRQGKSQDQCQKFFHGWLFLLLFCLFCRFCSAACSVLSCYHGRSILSTTEFSEKYNYFVL